MHGTKIKNHHSKAEPISRLTAHSQLLQKVIFFINDEVWVECPKLGHAHYPMTLKLEL